MKYYLAIDIGASSGRHILGYIQGGKLCMEEIYRFENHVTPQNGHLCWDIEHLTNEVIEGLCQCKKLGKIPSTIGIDTWGVDYVLLDKNGNRIDPVYAYRDDRTQKTIPLVEEILPFSTLYSITGIQKQPFNTIYQLYDDLKEGRLEHAEDFLMIPDYLGYVLTGEKKHEYTNATTTGMLDAKTYTWSKDIISKLGIPSHLFKEISFPEEKVGNLKEEIAKQVGFQSEVILVASHDTGSAVLAYPSSEDEIYLSSGTWSLIGVENQNPILTKQSMESNFTNEGGAYKAYRYLKNIMGSWMLQNIRKETMQELGKKVSFAEMIALARTSSFKGIMNVNEHKFLSPTSMIEAVRSSFPNQELSLADVLSAVYHSLANEYKNAVEEIEKICDKEFHKIFIFGGGCQDLHLDELTKEYTKKRVFIGPIEATAIGNILVQLLKDQVVNDVKEARDLVYNSFEIKEVTK